MKGEGRRKKEKKGREKERKREKIKNIRAGVILLIISVKDVIL